MCQFSTTIEPFLRYQLQLDYRRVRKGQEIRNEEQKRIDKILWDIVEIRKEFPHLKGVKTGILFQLIEKQGLDTVTDCAAHNLSAFTFQKAMKKRALIFSEI